MHCPTQQSHSSVWSMTLSATTVSELLLTFQNGRGPAECSYGYDEEGWVLEFSNTQISVTLTF